MISSLTAVMLKAVRQRSEIEGLKLGLRDNCLLLLVPVADSGYCEYYWFHNCFLFFGSMRSATHAVIRRFKTLG